VSFFLSTFAFLLSGLIVVTRLSSELYSLQGYHSPFVAASSSSTKPPPRRTSDRLPVAKRRRTVSSSDEDDDSEDDDEAQVVSTAAAATDAQARGKKAAAGTGYSGDAKEDVRRSIFIRLLPSSLRLLSY
jgi:hypothetical protein